MANKLDIIRKWLNEMPMINRQKGQNMKYSFIVSETEPVSAARIIAENKEQDMIIFRVVGSNRAIVIVSDKFILQYQGKTLLDKKIDIRFGERVFENTFFRNGFAVDPTLENRLPYRMLSIQIETLPELKKQVKALREQAGAMLKYEVSSI